jgi:hypothetical protein
LVFRDGQLRLYAYIDASFAREADKKSTTGAVIYLGAAILWATSTKQGVVSKSSTEAELIALSDVLSMVIWFSLLLEELGFGGAIPTVYQDNKSAMVLAQRGYSNNPNMRHVDVRRLWVKQFLDNKKINLEFVRTAEMQADGMTKPLTGAAFAKYLVDLGIGVDA